MLNDRVWQFSETDAIAFDELRYQCGQRISVAVHSKDIKGRLSLTNVRQAAPQSLAEWRYEEGSVVPTRHWRELTVQEEACIRRLPKHGPHGSVVGVVSTPSHLLEPFQALRILASRARTEEELFPSLKAPACAEALSAFARHAFTVFGKSPDSESIATIDGGLHVKPPGLPTTTVHRDTKVLIGLHIDDWYSYPLNERHLAPNRICINLGCEDRFFLFLNVPIAEMHRLVCAKSKTAQHYGGTLTARTFLRLFPDYPVLRLRLQPGEGYIAPTENIMHDATSLGMATMDVTISIRGFFDPSRRSGEVRERS